MGSSSDQGAGVSPLFPPAGLDEDLARAQIAHVVHRSPYLFDVDRSSWTLRTIGSVIEWMSTLSVTAIFQYLHRFGLTYKRGRVHVHSPDPLYNQKCASIARARDLALQAPGEVVFLYADEHTANLRPRAGRTYEQKGQPAPKATGATSVLIRLAGAIRSGPGKTCAQSAVRSAQQYCLSLSATCYGQLWIVPAWLH